LNGLKLVIGSKVSVKFWDVQTWKEDSAAADGLTLYHKENTSLACSADGAVLALAGPFHVHLGSIQIGEGRKTLELRHGDTIRALAFTS